MVSKSGKTTIHITNEQLEKILLLRAEYTHKMKIFCKPVEFWDVLINAATKEITSLPIKEVVDGKLEETAEVTGK